MVTNDDLMARVVELNRKVDTLLQLHDKGAAWLSVNQIRERYQVSPDAIKAAIAEGRLAARPHIARGGFKSFKVKAVDAEQLYGVHPLAV